MRGESFGSTSLLRSARSGEIAAQAARARIPHRQATRDDDIGRHLAPTRSTFRRSSRKWKRDRKSTRLNSSHLVISYAVFCLKKKKQKTGSKQNQCGRRSSDT